MAPEQTSSKLTRFIHEFFRFDLIFLNLLLMPNTLHSLTKVLTDAITLFTILSQKKSIQMLRKLQYLPHLNLQALLKSYKVHLKRLSAPEDHKRHEKLAKNVIGFLKVIS